MEEIIRATVWTVDVVEKIIRAAVWTVDVAQSIESESDGIRH